MACNRQAMDFWLHVRTQWRAGGFGLVGLDYPAIRGEARALGLVCSLGLMRKLQALERFELGRRSKDESGSQSQHTGSE